MILGTESLLSVRCSYLKQLNVHCMYRYLADRRKSCYENVRFLRAPAEERLAITSVFRIWHQ